MGSSILLLRFYLLFIYSMFLPIHIKAEFSSVSLAWVLPGHLGLFWLHRGVWDVRTVEGALSLTHTKGSMAAL